MAADKIATINANDGELNLLFRELLEGCRDDLEEARLTVSMYLDEIEKFKKDGGIERFGSGYNDALKIKGQARDRQLKLINIFKDRVSTKEKINLTKKDESIGGMPDIAEMNKVIEEMQKANNSTVKVVLNDESEYSKSLLEQELEEENNYYEDEENIFNDDNLDDE